MFEEQVSILGCGCVVLRLLFVIFSPLNLLAHTFKSQCKNLANSKLFFAIKICLSIPHLNETVKICCMNFKFRGTVKLSLMNSEFSETVKLNLMNS